MAGVLFSEWVNPDDSMWTGKGDISNDRYIPYHDISGTGQVGSELSTSGWYRGSKVLSGKVYLEMHIARTGTIMGLCDLDLNITSTSGAANTALSDNQYLYIQNGKVQTNSAGFQTVTGLPSVGNHDYMIAIDTTTGEVWLGANGAWIDDPTSDSATVTINAGLKLSTYFNMSAENCRMPNSNVGGQRDYLYPTPTGFEQQWPNTQGGLGYVKSGLSLRYSPYGLFNHSTISSSIYGWYKSTPIPQGKIYLEMSRLDNNCIMGIASNTYTLTGAGNSSSTGDVPLGSHITTGDVLDHMIFGTSGIFNSNGGTRVSNSTLGLGQTTQGFVTMIAIDTTTGEVWLGSSGTWADNPDTDPATLTLNTNVEWCIFGRNHGSVIGNYTPVTRSQMRYTVPTGFKVPTSEFEITGTVVDTQGQPVADARIRSHTRNSGVLHFETTSDSTGTYELGLPDGESYAVCDGTPGFLINGFDTENLPVDYQFNYAGTGGTPTEPTFRAMIRGNVKKLGLPYGAEIVGVSNSVPPTVVGTTTSDSITGDYELDVAPYQGQCNVMAIPDYGVEFSADAVYPLDAKVRPSVPNGYLYRVTEAGTTGGTEPTWPTTENQVVTSGGVTMVTEYMLRPLVNSLLLPVIEPI